MTDTSARFEIHGRMLARNWVLTVAAQALPLVIGVVSVPIILRGLGTERFGLLVFSWTLTGAFTVFDLGLAGAVTKFVAEVLGRGDARAIPGILWTAVAGQAVLGIISAVVLILLTPLLVTRLLHLSSAVASEAIAAFRIAGLILPVMLLINSFRGAVEAAQRFDVSAGIKSASSASTFLIPLVGVFARWSLPEIIVGLLIVRLFLLVLLVVACMRVLPMLARPIRIQPEAMRQLFRFGGWITVTNLTGFAITYGDRFIIGSVLTMTAVAYYSVPLELIARLGVIAGTLAAVLMPAFSTLGAAGNRPRLSRLFGRSVKYATVTTVPAFGLVAVFAPDILRLWLGPLAAAQSAPVLRLLAVGAAFQVLGVIPITVIQGLGRPDLVAKLRVAQTPAYLALLWWLVRVAGISGAAAAWSVRFFLEVVILLWVAARLGVWSWQQAGGALRRVAVPAASACALSALMYTLPVTIVQRVTLVAGVMIAFGWWVWTSVLYPEERRWMLQVAAGWRRHS